MVLSVPSGTITDAALSLNSTIQTVAITPVSTTLVASALDITGAVELTWVHRTWASDNPAVAKITPHGALASV